MLFQEEEIQDKKPQIPTIQVSGIAVSQLPPKSGVIQVHIQEKASSQEAAWSKFQQTTSRFRDNVGDNGSIGNVMPRESSEEVSRALRSGMEFTVKACIDIEFEPAKYGNILKALISSDLSPTIPRFVYDKTPSTSPELYTEATAKAKENARAVALGVDGRLGRLVSINIGPPRIKPVFRKQSEILFSTAVSMSVAREFNFAGLDEDKLETFDTEVQITVEFEIIENAKPMETE
jgi:uncharacterized protein YggE